MSNSNSKYLLVLLNVSWRGSHGNQLLSPYKAFEFFSAKEVREFHWGNDDELWDMGGAYLFSRAKDGHWKGISREEEMEIFPEKGNESL